MTDVTIAIPTTIPFVVLPRKYPMHPHNVISNSGLRFSAIYFIINIVSPQIQILHSEIEART